MLLTKQCVGIDISKATFNVSLLGQSASSSDVVTCRRGKKFANTASGFTEFVGWLQTVIQPQVSLVFVMEATGVYHEALAYFLLQRHYHVSIVLPNKVSAYARSLNQSSKTDALDAQLIARLGLERSLPAWTSPSPIIRQIKALTRHLQALTEAKTVTKNQLHAAQHVAYPLAGVLENYADIIALYETKIALLEREIKALVRTDKSMADLIENLQTIPGVGFRTASAIVAETGCFQLFTSRGQLLKFAGMDIKEKQSGSSVHGRSRLSKTGNSRIRRALYMPSLQFTRGDNPISQLYARVLDRTGIKMKALVAAQRKLLVVMYALAKTGQAYQADYAENRHRKRVGEPKLAYSDSIGQGHGS